MSGIAVAGNILVDKINQIAKYPASGELVEIASVKNAVGGCVPNVAIDLKTISPETEVYAVGKVGGDEEGRYVCGELSRRGVDVNGVKVCEDKTSFTEVMSVYGGQRTFFTYAGANAAFGFEDIAFDDFRADMLHLGYFLLLNKVDKGDGLKILREAKVRGIRTSIDLVSKNGGVYEAVIECLPYVDNLIINEIEAGGLAGMAPTEENLIRIAEKLYGYGVRERVVIHKPELSVCFSENGATVLGSYELPNGFIRGTTGAGDAFCAGCLLGIYGGEKDEEILSFASAAAVAALSEEDAVSGMRSGKEIRALCKNFKRKNICL